PAADIGAALEVVRSLAARHAQVFCEGAGGWLVPIAKDYTIADFAADLGWPIVVVVRNKLGALNHTLLTLENIRHRGLALAGIVLNDLEGQPDEATRTNRRVLEEFCGCPVLGEIERGQTKLPTPI
ncbi:MAG: ATP-dependent dethiobiotin synthetase BioD, partial [Chthoniobacterales bacterium]